MNSPSEISYSEDETERSVPSGVPNNPKYKKTSTYDLGNGQFQRHYGPHSHTISTGLLSRTKVWGIMSPSV